MNNTQVDELIQRALAEDIAGGDVTTESLFLPTDCARAVVRVKQDGVIAGLLLLEKVFQSLEHSFSVRLLARDGDGVKAGQIVAELEGSARALLSGERLALNLLQRMSGIASLAAKYVEAVRGLPVKILDTRKTAPGLRAFDKYAVRMGGATNHRLTLNDLAMVKDNHIKLAGGITSALSKIRAAAPSIRIEVETTGLNQINEALAAGADIIMLDNMPIPTMREAVALIRKTRKDIQIEASGNITLNTVRAIAETGVDFISIGALTHSPPALDISLKTR